MNSGIYAIINKETDKFYIGSTKDFDKRKYQHFSELEKGKHRNIYLQNSWNKYGKEVFEFKILERVGVENLREREQWYIDKYYDYRQKCYNINTSAIDPPHFTKFIVMYDDEGNKTYTFNSIKEARATLKCQIRTLYLHSQHKVVGKYRLMCYDSIDDIKQTIEPYIEEEKQLILVLGDEDKVVNSYTLEELYIFLNAQTRVEKNIIQSKLLYIHKYKGIKIIYLTDYEKFGYPQGDLTKYKYTLKYDTKGNLLEVIENTYGNCNVEGADNAKKNTRRRVLGRTAYEVYKSRYIFLKSNTVDDKISTGVTHYYINDVNTNDSKEFLNQKDAYLYIGMTRAKFQYYLSNNIAINGYKFYTVTY